MNAKESGKKKSIKLPPLQELKQYSIYGELITVSPKKEDIQNRRKQIIFPDMNSDIAIHYYALNSNNQRIVENIVAALTENEQHHGFNLSVVLEWFKNNDNYKDQDQNKAKDKKYGSVSQWDIARHFQAAHGEELNENKRKTVNSITEDSELYSSAEIYGSIQSLKGTAHFTQQSEVLFQAILDNLFISREIVTEGQGEVYSIKKEILDMYKANIKFQETVRDKILDEFGEMTKDKYLVISTSAAIELFAKEIGKTWDEVKETEYAVINYSCGYMFLDKSPIKGAKKLVDNLIEDLYASQLEAEAWHAAAFQTLFAKMINEGIEIRKGDFSAIVELSRLIE